VFLDCAVGRTGNRFFRKRRSQEQNAQRTERQDQGDSDNAVPHCTGRGRRSGFPAGGISDPTGQRPERTSGKISAATVPRVPETEEENVRAEDAGSVSAAGRFGRRSGAKEYFPVFRGSVSGVRCSDRAVLCGHFPCRQDV